MAAAIQDTDHVTLQLWFVKQTGSLPSPGRWVYETVRIGYSEPCAHGTCHETSLANRPHAFHQVYYAVDTAGRVTRTLNTQPRRSEDEFVVSRVVLRSVWQRALCDLKASWERQYIYKQHWTDYVRAVCPGRLRAWLPEWLARGLGYALRTDVDLAVAVLVQCKQLPAGEVAEAVRTPDDLYQRLTSLAV